MNKNVCYPIKQHGYLVLSKITYVRRYDGPEKQLKEYHYMRDDEYERNPTPYCIDIDFVNGKTYIFRYADEKERDEVFKSLIDAINEYHNADMREKVQVND